MEQRKMVKWLKFLVIFVAICGLILCTVVIPVVGRELSGVSPELGRYFKPWVTFVWVLVIPCFAALVHAWMIFSNIEKDKAFSMENAKHMEKISYLAGADTIALISGNIVLLILNINHPSVFLVFLMIGIIGIGISVAAAVLSHLIQKAANLQDENDLTI